VRLGSHLLQGTATVALLFPLLAPGRRRSLKQRWSERLLRVLNIRLQRTGMDIAPGVLLIANHISWLDIFVINAVAPSAFVSKDDVQGWPLVGWLAARNDTIFLRRGHRREARRISEEVGAALAAGMTVAVFPEGTTTEGRGVRTFHGALLQPAIDAGRPIQPLALSYRLPGGDYCAAPAYAGETSFGESLRAILTQPEIQARLEVCAALPTIDADRRNLAARAHALIAARIGGAGAEPGIDFAPEPALTQPA
jgi:1-acyl-sn-glycerol-3-phosphate acyltransferase